MKLILVNHVKEVCSIQWMHKILRQGGNNFIDAIYCRMQI